MSPIKWIAYVQDRDGAIDIDRCDTLDAALERARCAARFLPGCTVGARRVGAPRPCVERARDLSEALSGICRSRELVIELMNRRSKLELGRQFKHA